MYSTLRRSLATFACLSSVTLAALPASASADPGGAAAAASSSASCPAQPVTQPFAAWGDSSDYALVPGGDFESDGWSLSGGATRVSGSEPFAGTGTVGASSVSLPAGGSADSPALCIDSGSPSLRFFIAGTGNVQVTAEFAGNVYPLGVAHAGGDWAPSSIVRSRGTFFSRQAGGPAQITLSFVALNGNPQIDDVFIDPWNRT